MKYFNALDPVTQYELQRGDMVSKQEQNGIVVPKWKGVCDVRLLSTKHEPKNGRLQDNRKLEEAEPLSQLGLSRGARRKTRRTVRKPEGILAYNKGKIGIDISDQENNINKNIQKIYLHGSPRSSSATNSSEKATCQTYNCSSWRSIWVSVSAKCTGVLYENVKLATININ